MMNTYLGAAPISIGGDVLTLVYDWRAIARIRSGEDVQQKAFSGDVDALSELIAAGLQRHHPDWTAPRVYDASPAIHPAIEAVTVALNASYFGPDGAPDDDGEPDENPTRRARGMIWTLLSRLCARPTGRT